jgi:hypothetical protein
MTEQQHPITPPPELVAQIRSDALHGSDGQLDYELRMIHAAFRAGADQELAACVEWLEKGPYGFSIAASASDLTSSLRAVRRPKPPSLAEQAMKDLAVLLDIAKRGGVFNPPDTIRLALERLQKLEQVNNG